jgi:hypothetical protein
LGLKERAVTADEKEAKRIDPRSKGSKREGALRARDSCW